MSYDLFYHPDVLSKDIPAISQNIRERMARAIEARLKTHPERYGMPLRRTLKGYWKLRVGDYRVVFKIAKNDVWSYGMIHRREVYERIVRRLVRS